MSKAETYTSKLLDDLYNDITLGEILRVTFQMHDYENWENGEYYGDAEKYVEIALREMKDYIQNHFPEISKEITIK